VGRKSKIGTLSETSLHAGLKEWYARPGDVLEANLGGYVVDVLRPGLLVEIQTGYFYQIRSKLEALLDDHAVRLVYPVAREKWIVRQSVDGTSLGKRKSPRRGRFEDLFSQLVYIPGLLDHPNLSLEVLLTREEEIWRDDGKGSWRRRGWRVHDRRLLEVLSSRVFSSSSELSGLLPADLPDLFTSCQLAAALGCRLALAQKIVYTLRQCGVVELLGKQGRAHLYTLSA